MEKQFVLLTFFISGQFLLSYTPFGSDSSVIYAGKRKGKAQWSEGNKRRVSLQALGSKPRDACGSICGRMCYKWKKYHKEIGKALGITQPHVATENA